MRARTSTPPAREALDELLSLHSQIITLLDATELLLDDGAQGCVLVDMIVSTRLRAGEAQRLAERLWRALPPPGTAALELYPDPEMGAGGAGSVEDAPCEISGRGDAERKKGAPASARRRRGRS